MGFFRGGIILMLGILLFLSFFIMNSFFILSSSLKYENVKTDLYPLVKDMSMSGTGLIPKEIIGNFNLTNAATDSLNAFKYYCSNQNNTHYVFSYQGYTIDVPCQLANSSSPESFINETYNSAIHDIYYKQYDCKFWDCFSKTKLPFFLVSEKAMNYWKSKFYFFLLSSLILIALIFLFVEQKMNTLTIVGSLLALSAFPLLKLNVLLLLLFGILSLAGNFSALINIFLSIFLSSTHGVFLFSLILGILLIGTGVGLRLWKPDLIKKKLSKKDVEEIVKDEISQEKKKQKNKKK